MNRDPDSLDHLADALSEDLIAAPADRLVAEAAEDAGDGGAFAAAFDRVAARATRQAGRRRVAERLRALGTALVPRHAWRPAMAAVAAVGVIAVAGDLYLHVPSQPMVQASVPPRMPVREAAPAMPTPVMPAPSMSAPSPMPSFGPERRAAARSPADKAGGAVPVVAAAPNIAAQAPSQPAVADDRLPALLARALTASAQDEAAKTGTAPTGPTVAARAGPPSSAPLSFGWPLRGPLLIGFGGSDRAAPNDGIDVAVPVGTDIRAAADGVIVYAGGDGDHIKGFGKLILVRHRDGFVTVYAYASRILVKPNDKVSRGQVIAKSGRSGGAGVPKLHFEIRKGTAPVDPAQYLPAT